jgi:hypothetical protein
MPHKINPIRFENAEANLEISSGLFEVLEQTLVYKGIPRAAVPDAAPTEPTAADLPADGDSFDGA